MIAEISQKFGSYIMKECNVPFSPALRADLEHTIFTECALPVFAVSPIRVSYHDGCKNLFLRMIPLSCAVFSGTEPLLRIFAEGHTQEQAQSYIEAWKSLLKIL